MSHIALVNKAVQFELEQNASGSLHQERQRKAIFSSHPRSSSEVVLKSVTHNFIYISFRCFLLKAPHSKEWVGADADECLTSTKLDVDQCHLLCQLFDPVTFYIIHFYLRYILIEAIMHHNVVILMIDLFSRNLFLYFCICILFSQKLYVGYTISTMLCTRYCTELIIK